MSLFTRKKDTPLPPPPPAGDGLPEWVHEAVGQLAHAEGTDEVTVVTEAILAHLRAVAPELVVNTDERRTQRDMAIKLVNKILADAVRDQTPKVVLRRAEPDFEILHERDGQRQVHETFPLPWLALVCRRLRFMALYSGDIPIRIIDDTYRVALAETVSGEVVLTFVSETAPNP